MRLWIDIETRGPNFSQGLAKYALTAEVIMVQWAIDDGHVVIEDLTADVASDHIIAAVEACDEIWAHEAGFDRTILETTDWWPKVPLEKWRCTAALARMHGLPGRPRQALPNIQGERQ